MVTSDTISSFCECEPRSAPASRASWCGQLQIDDLGVPVKAYAAVVSPPETPLRQLHAGCGRRIEYRKCCPTHGAVSQDEIVKGYPYQPEQYVELSQSDLDQLQPTDDKTIHLEHFLEPRFFDPVLFAGRSLYLIAANPAAQRSFAVLQRSLDHCGKWGLGRVVLSNRRQIVVVRPFKQALLMHTLHHPAQTRALPATQSGETEITQTELRPITRTIRRLNGSVNWDGYRDDTDRRLATAVESKIRARQKPRLSSPNGKRRTSNRRAARNSRSPASNSNGRPRRKAA